MVSKGCTLLEVSEASDDIQGHRGRLTNLEVVAGAFGLSSPELVGRHLDFSKGILFDSVVHYYIS